jgi:hypothetical protein
MPGLRLLFALVAGCLVCTLTTAAGAASVGVVQTQSGEATAYLGEFPRDLAPRDALHAEDTLVTAPFSRLQCVFSNGLRLVMGAESAMTIKHIALTDGTALTELYLGPGVFRIAAAQGVKANEISLIGPTGAVRSTGGELGVTVDVVQDAGRRELLEQLPTLGSVPALMEAAGQAFGFREEYALLGGETGQRIQFAGDAGMELVAIYPAAMRVLGEQGSETGPASETLHRRLANVALDVTAEIPRGYPQPPARSKGSMDVFIKSNSKR